MFDPSVNMAGQASVGAIERLRAQASRRCLLHLALLRGQHRLRLWRLLSGSMSKVEPECTSRSRCFGPCSFGLHLAGPGRLNVKGRTRKQLIVSGLAASNASVLSGSMSKGRTRMQLIVSDLAVANASVLSGLMSKVEPELTQVVVSRLALLGATSPVLQNEMDHWRQHLRLDLGSSLGGLPISFRPLQDMCLVTIETGVFSGSSIDMLGTGILAGTVGFESCQAPVVDP